MQILNWSLRYIRVIVDYVLFVFALMVFAVFGAFLLVVHSWHSAFLGFEMGLVVNRIIRASIDLEYKVHRNNH